MHVQNFKGYIATCSIEEMWKLSAHDFVACVLNWFHLAVHNSFIFSISINWVNFRDKSIFCESWEEDVLKWSTKWISTSIYIGKIFRNPWIPATSKEYLPKRNGEVPTLYGQYLSKHWYPEQSIDSLPGPKYLYMDNLYSL